MKLTLVGLRQDKHCYSYANKTPECFAHFKETKFSFAGKGNLKHKILSKRKNYKAFQDNFPFEVLSDFQNFA